jgi:hypothetical protein
MEAIIKLIAKSPCFKGTNSNDSSDNTSSVSRYDVLDRDLNRLKERIDLLEEELENKYDISEVNEKVKHLSENTELRIVNIKDELDRLEKNYVIHSNNMHDTSTKIAVLQSVVKYNISNDSANI